MTDSSYPLGKDEIRLYVDGICDMVAQDMNDAFDVAVAIEEELGLEPSGNLGTVLGRLFARGNLSKKDGGWRRLDWKIVSNQNSTGWDERGTGYRLGYSVNRWKGNETALGEDKPTPFMALQAHAAQITDWPWQIVCSEVEPDRSLFWGRDGTVLRLQVNRNDVKVAYVLWGLL
jgi:hypothetical protein